MVTKNTTVCRALCLIIALTMFTMTPISGLFVINAYAETSEHISEHEQADNDTPDDGNFSDTLYVQLENIVFNIQYDANGGKDAPIDTMEYHGMIFGRAAEQGNMTRDGFIFTGWNTNAKGNGTSYQPGEMVSAKGSVTLYAQWKETGNVTPGDGGDDDATPGDGDNNIPGGSTNPGLSGGSGGNWGGNSGGNVTSYLPNKPQTVTTLDAANSVNAALKAMKAAGGASATVKLRNPGAISLETLQAMARAAGTTPLIVHADSMTEDGNSVDVRLRFNPSSATKAVNLFASITSNRANSTKAVFEKWFNNTIFVINCNQQGDFGMNIEVAAKINPKLNKDTLVFYTYDWDTNSYKAIGSLSEYWIDANGYVHFSTTFGGDIIITDKPLQKK